MRASLSGQCAPALCPCSCEVPAKHAATEEVVAEHLRQLYIDPAAVATHRVELSPPSGGYPWQRKEVDVESFLAGQVRRAEDDEMTAIMSQPQQAVPCIRWVGHQQASGCGINRPVGGASAGRYVDVIV